MNFSIKGRAIGPGHPTYIVAEMSANHGHNYDRAVAILRAAKEAGADAVKLQTYTADTMTIRSDQKFFHINGTLWNGRNLYDLYGEAYTPWEWQPKLKKVADELKLDLFSTPFDASAVEFLEKMDVPAHKIASFEVVDLPLIRRVAQTGKPTIMSTGMASLAEIEEAVLTFRKAGGKQLALLKCTSAYPSLPDDMNLQAIANLSETFQVVTGLSDHTLGTAVSVAAVALGARIIERHVTLSRADVTPDSAFSLEPQEFKAMVDAIRVTEKALGSVRYGLTEEETKSRIFRRSLFVVKDMKSGEAFSPENVRAIRPGYGMHTRHLEEVMGRHANKPILRGTPLSWELVN